MPRDDRSSPKGTPSEALPSGTALKLLIAYTGVSQKLLADACEIGQPEISRYVSGEKQIPNKHRARILETLQLTPLGWGVVEDAVIELERDRNRFVRRSRTEHAFSEVRTDEIREPFGSGSPVLDPETADDLVSGLTGMIESSLRRLVQPWVMSRR